MRILLFIASLVWSVLPAYAQFFVESEAEEAGFSESRLARLDSVIDRAINDRKLAGVVSLIVRDGHAVRFRPYGMRNVGAGIPMQTDAIFRIASMSKAVTSVAVMILYEDGLLMLNDPLHKFIPAFKDAVVASKPPEDAPDSVEFVLAPAKRPITVHDLLTHRAGLTYGSGAARSLYQEAGLFGWYFADKDEPIGKSIERLGTLPLHGHPGKSWQYGFATDVLGHLVEVVSGMPLDDFFRTRIFELLGMHDTTFFLPADKSDRLAPVYGVGESGELELREPTSTTDYIHGPRRNYSGGAGLLSTASDYGRFLQMLLGDGELDGVRVLSPHSVELMRTNHVGAMYAGGRLGFGLGFWVIEDLGRWGEVGTVGAYGWGSAYYPIYWIDPKECLFALIMTQLIPAGGLNLNQIFYVMTYHALVE